MAARSHASATYRFGFNGKENDNETYGTGNAVDFGARIYDPRIGRWLSTDPLQAKYPSWTPYKAFLCNPIVFIDPTGLSEQTKYYDAKTGSLLADINDGIDQSVKVDKDQFERAQNYASNSGYDIQNKKEDALLFTNTYQKVASDRDNGVQFEVTGNWPTVEDVLKDVDPVSFTVNCFDAAKKQCTDAKVYPGGSDKSTHMLVDNTLQKQEGKGNLTPNVPKALSIIDKQIENGQPTLIGINHGASNNANTNVLTEHFVVITGRGNDFSGNYYLYIDNVASWTPRADNKLYFKDNILIDKENWSIQNSDGGPFKATEVRPNQ